MRKSLVLKLSHGGGIVGVASQDHNGLWRFFPRVCGRSPSRKGHPTADACLPAWARKMLPRCSFLPPEPPTPLTTAARHQLGLEKMLNDFFDPTRR